MKYCNDSNKCIININVNLLKKTTLLEKKDDSYLRDSCHLLQYPMESIIAPRSTSTANDYPL